MRLLVPENAGQEATDRFDDHDNGRLAPGQDVVPDADLVDGHPRAGLGDDPGVDPFVPPAGEYQMRLARVGSRQLLGKGRAARRRHDQARGRACGGSSARRRAGKPRTGKPRVRKPRTGKPRTGKPRVRKPRTGKRRIGKPRVRKPSTGKPRIGKPRAGEHGVEGIAPDIGLHDHARPATKGSVVDRVMHVGRPRAKVMHTKINVSARPGLPDQRDAKRPGPTDPAIRADGPKVLRENSDNIDPHANPCLQTHLRTRQPTDRGPRRGSNAQKATIEALKSANEPRRRGAADEPALRAPQPTDHSPRIRVNFPDRGDPRAG